MSFVDLSRAALRVQYRIVRYPLGLIEKQMATRLCPRALPRQLYERSKNILEAAVESWERSLDAASQGAVVLNRKVIDIAQRNINSSFDLAKNLAGAKNFAEAMELQAAYWPKQLGALQAQAEEVRTLSTKVAADATEPIKTQMTRGMDELHNKSSRLPL